MDELATLEPSFVSVTYGALGTTRDTTKTSSIRVNQERPFPAMPHLTCVGHTRADLVDLLERTTGTPASRTSSPWPATRRPTAPDDGGDFTYATELVELVARWAASRSAWRPSPSCTPVRPTGRPTGSAWPTSWRWPTSP